MLLRSICPIQASEGASLESLKKERNKLLHSNFKYTRKKYDNVWNRITSILEDLGCDKQGLIDLKAASLDPALETQRNKLIHDWKQALQQVADLEDSLEGVTYNVCSSIPSFVGREKELLDMHQKLTEDNENQLAIVVYGLGGVGKSELARQYCQQYGTSYYMGNVIWINAENKNSLSGDFKNVAERIKLITTDAAGKPLSIKTIISKVYRFFNNRPVLFVFDNVENQSEVSDFLEKHESNNASVIITTQYTEWSERFVKLETDVLSKDAASKLIHNSVTKKSILNKESSDLLCEKMQCLPLALQQAIAYINRWSMTVEEYLIQFEQHADKLMNKHHGDDKYDKTMLTTWNMALEKLLQEDNSSFAITLINYMSYLDGNDIKKELFYEYYDQQEVRDALELLQKYSLIRITSSDDDSAQIILMNSLVQRVLQMKAANDDRIDHNYLRQFLNVIFNHMKTKGDSEIQHVSFGKYWCNHFIHILSNKEWSSNIAEMSEEYVSLLYHIMRSKGKLPELLKLLNIIESYQTGLKYSRRMKTQYYVALCLHEIGDVDGALHRYVKLEQWLIETNDRLLPLSTPSSTATCLLLTENFVEALDKFVEKSLMEFSDKECYSREAVQTRIGMCFLQKANFDDALTKFLELEKWQRENLGDKNSNTLLTQLLIVFCSYGKEDYDAAYAKSIKILEWQREIHDNQHHRILPTKLLIAHCLAKKGLNDRALSLFKEIIRLQISKLGNKHTDTLAVRKMFATCLFCKGSYDDALDKYTELETLESEVFGNDHQKTMATRNQIAQCLYVMKQYGEALAKFVQNEKLQRVVLGKKHPETLSTQRYIGACLLKKGDHNEAFFKFSELEKIQQEIYDDTHPDILDTKRNIIASLFDKGDYDEILLDKCLKFEKLQTKVLDNTHPDILETKNIIAECLCKRGYHRDGVAKFIEIEKLQKKSLGIEHPDTLGTRNKITYYFRNINKYN